MFYEYAGNLHAHTVYSDGHGLHEDLARAAIHAGLDFLVVTDHNVYVSGVDGYYTLGERKVLLLAGEEVHDQIREPQKNHLLIFEAGRELAPLAPEPQRLLDAVREADGLSFIAHPVDPAAPTFNEDDLSWVDWEVNGYVGLEIWNFMSEFKGLFSRFRSVLRALPVVLFYAYNPSFIARGPFPEALQRWDALLASGKHVVAIGGADAHATPASLGPLRRVIFPYDFLFRAVNTHVLTNEPLTGEAATDRKRIFHSLRRGRCFVGYDLPAPTRGFRFSAQGDQGQAIMGDSIQSRFGVTLQMHLPRRAELRLLRDGEVIATWTDIEAAVYVTDAPGAYRVEAYLDYRGRRRAWIFSNPIYVHG